jgi:hypothetical protein
MSDMNTPKTTAVDWLREKIQSNLSEPMSPKFAELFEEARDMERENLTNLVQSLMDYTFESHSILGYDEREASEFVDVYLNGGQHGE